MKTVLVLHGYSQNGSIFSKRLGALRKECAKDIEFVFVDAPHLLQPVDIVSSATHIQELGLQGEIQANVVDSDPDSSPRAWWKANAEKTKCIGIEESILVIRDVLQRRKFDGVLGFSQGAAFAAVIAALLEKPELYPPFLVDGKTPHPPFEFCVAVSGFRALDPLCDSLWKDGFCTPILHILGRTDVIVVEERSRQLIEISNEKRVEEHPGGHFVPSKGSWRKFLAAYLKDPLGPHPSPGASYPTTGPSSSEISGTSTPSVDGANNAAALTMKL